MAKQARRSNRSSRAGAMRVLVLGVGAKSQVRALAARLEPWLEQRVRIVGIDLEQKMDLSRTKADLTIVLGGDGAMLRAARQMGHNQIPVVGVNVGKLGFLTEFTEGEFHDRFEAVLRGEYHVGEHLVLECTAADSQGRTEKHLVFNDVVVSAGPPFQLIDIDLTIDGEPVTTYSGDGLILSTPVGSTAHSLAAGGPILRQELEAVVITPICPHTLANRPLVDRADKEYELVVTRASRGAKLILDGQIQRPVRRQAPIRVRRAPVHFKLVRTEGHNYYRTLSDKLRWGGQPNYGVRPNQ
jgi:NAD+ kinase